MSEQAAAPQVFQENLTTAQLDAARIAVHVAAVLVQSDETIADEGRLVFVLQRLAVARQLLDEASEALGGPSTSVHIITPGRGGIITP